jgi:hypothetical protein
MLFKFQSGWRFWNRQCIHEYVRIYKDITVHR